MSEATFIDRRIMASAGTGKTWNLAARYLDLVLAGVDPSTILATTFTRAAAAEIRDRVLTDAAGLVLDPKERTKAAGDGRFKTGSVDEATAARLLHELVRRLPDLQIRTLDSLFVSLAAGLGTASGVPVGARMADADQAAALLREGIGLALEDADEGELLSTLETLGRGATKVAVVSTVERAISGLLAVAEESTDDAWNWPMPPRDADAIDSVAAALAAADPALGKQVLKAVNGLSAMLMIAGKTDGEIWRVIQESTLVAASGPEGTGTYYKKPIPDSLVPALERLHRLAVDGNRRNLARRTGCLHDLVARVEPHLRRLKRRHRLAVFDDFVRALDPIRGEASPDSLAELWFRLDTSLEHLLLDEFQDTSATQLRAIRPVATEILSGGDGERPRSLLVVGDVKQSIYGWRGGDPAILERLDEVIADGPVDFDDVPLATSYRSSQAVVDLVNAIFEGIAHNGAVRQRSAAAADHFGRLFNTHDTMKKHAGRGTVEFLPETDDERDRMRVLAESAAEAAAALVERHGLARSDGEPSVAVLVRSNKPIGPIVEALRARRIPASGRGGGSLLDAEAAVAVVQAFRLAADPEDRFAAEDLARSPLASMVGLPASEGHARVADAERRIVGRRLRARFGEEGPAEVVDGWRRELADRLTARESARLRQLVEQLEAIDADPEGPRSPRAVAHHLQTCRVDDPGGDGVVVMTIHQSKGLEFPGVVVTEMHQSLFRQPTVAVATPEIPATPSEQVATWYNEKTRPVEAIQVHDQATDRVVLESLCGLYVALTRAASDLVVQVERPRFNRDGGPSLTSVGSLGGVVRAAIGVDGDEHAAKSLPDDQDGTRLQEILVRTCPDETDASSRGEDAASSASAAGESPSWTVRPGSRRKRAVTAPPPSGDHDRASLLQFGFAGALERGRVVHAGFELLEWSSDLDRFDDQTLAQALARRCPVSSEVVSRDAADAWYLEQVGLIRTSLARPAVKSVFDGEAGPAAGDHRIVRREFPLVRRSGQGVQVGLIDRLVLHLDRQPGSTADGPPRVIAASIIDFKTDRPGDGSAVDAEGFLKRHRSQLESYRAGIQARYELDESRIRSSLIRIDDGLVVDLPGV